MSFHERGAVTAFLANGGGVITFRAALGVVAGVTLWLLQSFGVHIVTQLDGLTTSQARMAASLAGLAQQGKDTAVLSVRNADQLEEQDRRITELEARQSH